MAHCSVTSGKFVCPKDFTCVLNTQGLCLEDIDDCDLFIIQASADADLMKFHDQQLLLSGPTTLHCPGEDGQEEMYRCTVTNADRQVARACLVLPERNSVKLCAAQKHIEGVIHIEKRAAFPQIGYPEELYEKSKTPVNLKKKATPLSSGNSMVLSENYGKKGASNALTEDAPRTSDSSQSVRKKIHSKHRTQDTDPSADIAVKGKKKHKDKKQEDHVFHIQAKALSDSGENSCPDEDVPITGTECKNEIHSSMDPESTGSQMSQNDITSYKNHFASVKKKKKKTRMSHGAEESESPEKMGGSLSHEYSPRKPLKKKHKTLYSSFTDLHSEESRENDKTKHKSDKLKELSSKKKHGNSNNTHVNNFEIEEEIEQDNVLEENSCQLSTSLEQKSKKKKKKKENYDDQSSYTYIPSTQIKQEIEDYEVERNDSYTDHLNEVSQKEISSSCEKKAKKKKKKNFDDCSTSNSHISNLKIKEEIEDMVEGKSYYTNDLNENGSEKKAKKKKKENFDDCSTSNSHISNLKIKEEVEDTVEGKSCYTSGLNENGYGKFPLIKKRSQRRRKRKMKMNHRHIFNSLLKYYMCYGLKNVYCCK